MPALEFYHEAREALARAVSLDAVTGLRDTAEELRLYVQRAREGLEMQNWCAEIKLRAERRAGEMLAEQERQTVGRPRKQLFPDGTVSLPTLADLGLKPVQAHRYRVMASLPDALFEAHLAQKKAAKQELTSVGVYREARAYQPRKLTAPKRRVQAAGPVETHGRTPYRQWVTFLRQHATLLEEINHLGGFETIIARLTPAQVNDVIAQVHRLDHQVRKLMDEVDQAGAIVQMILTP